jgi:16S rRNA A1518/A1519 N6-dimethyltransferase RsmA/KsgA/DIM1 with predicted DNA glycosylase/AP lyase activity
MELKKSLGQHFLVHEEILDKIVAEIQNKNPLKP